MSRSGIARLKRQAFWQFETGIHFSLQQRIYFRISVFLRLFYILLTCVHHFGLFENESKEINKKFVG
jgi:hypothetical protein